MSDEAKLWRDALVVENEELRAEVERLRADIQGCGCPAPYDECPHDEPLLSVVKRQDAEVVRLREALTAAETAVDELAAEAEEWETENVRLCEALTAAEAETERMRFLMECADTPLMRDVMAERDAARAALTALTAAHQRFVEAHGSLLDYSQSAEMVDFDIALAAAVAAASDREADNG